ncbi:MAG: glycosyltransferase family 4 protein [Alphaproteobacteria bacterium]
MLSRDLGGIQQAFLDYSAALRQRGVEVINVSSWRAAINAFQKDMLHLPNLASWCPFSKLFVRFLVKRYQPDLVIAHGGRAIHFATSFKSSKAKVVGVAHNCWAYHRLKKPDYLICVAEHIRRYVVEQGYGEDKVFTIPNMIQLPKAFVPFQLDPQKPIVIGSYGRFSPEKGFADLICAIRILKERGYGVNLLLGGAGELEPSLRQQVEALGLQDVVTFAGWVKDKDAFFKSIDIFCLPSLEEAFGIALLEAMAHSKPLVASNISGPAEILTHEIDALLSEPGSPQDLADKLAGYMDHPEKASAFVEKAYQKMEKTYEMNRVSEKLVGILRRFLKCAKN